MSVRKAAREYGIPRTTIADHLVVLDRPDYVGKILKELVDAAVDCVKSEIVKRVLSLRFDWMRFFLLSLFATFFLVFFSLFVVTVLNLMRF